MAFFTIASSPACTSLLSSGCFNGLCRPILVVPLLYSRCFKASLRCLAAINQ